jgi:hypothetical protein
MPQWNRFSIETGRGQNRQVGDIEVANAGWDVAQDLFFYRILREDPCAIDVNNLSEESYKEANYILSMAIKLFGVLAAAIQSASIRMLQTLYSTT